MWCCAILPDDINSLIKQICTEANRDIGLPMDVFRFPLHISMKKSFRTSDFDSVKRQLRDCLERHGKMDIKVSAPVRNGRMIWLKVEKTESLMSLHEEMDRLLLERFAIPISEHDALFLPHISLFTGGDREKLDKMYGILEKKIEGFEPEVTRFVIGSSAHRDEYFDIRGMK